MLKDISLEDYNDPQYLEGNENMLERKSIKELLNKIDMQIAYKGHKTSEVNENLYK